jgi:hypothetical protein
MAITLDGTNGINSSGVIVAPDGSVSAPAITNDGDTNTGIFFPAADTIAFAEGGAEAMRIDSDGNVGIGTTSPSFSNFSAGTTGLEIKSSGTYGALRVGGETGEFYVGSGNSSVAWLWNLSNAPIIFGTNNAERARIDSSGNLLVGKTALNVAAAGFQVEPSGLTYTTVSGSVCLVVNRNTNDGALVSLRQANTEEGTISVSGTTVSYNGGHLSRYAQTTTAKDESLKKGTVLSNLDEMNVYVDADGNPVENEQLNKVKVSDVEGDANVAGVFVNWTYDEAHQVDEINMAMTGDMIIRIAQGTTVARGDLLMSAGDGTAKPQGDDIVRSKTIAKVTSTHVTCTYDDGSYCVPCVLMAC